MDGRLGWLVDWVIITIMRIDLSMPSMRRLCQPPYPPHLQLALAVGVQAAALASVALCWTLGGDGLMRV